MKLRPEFWPTAIMSLQPAIRWRDCGWADAGFGALLARMADRLRRAGIMRGDVVLVHDARALAPFLSARRRSSRQVNEATRAELRVPRPITRTESAAMMHKIPAAKSAGK